MAVRPPRRKVRRSLCWKNNRKVDYGLELNRHTDTVLLVLFDHLYTLRNQIIHGGATYGSSANRSQLRDACNILSALLPEILQVMQLHSARDWGRPFYPFVKDGD